MISPENQDDYPDHSALSRHFADFIVRLHGKQFPELYLASFLLCDNERQGHVCLDLHLLGNKTFYAGDAPIQSPPGAVWAELLRKSPLVGAPGDFCPLILDDAGRLYTYRYWRYERDVADNLLKRSQSFTPPHISPDKCREILRRLFPDSSLNRHSHISATAAFIALTRRLCLIAGGPGTGKTTALTRILAFLIEAAPQDHERIAIAAPTAKAAMRLRETAAQIKGTLPSPLWVKDAIPEKTTTLHRLLGSNRDGTSYQYSHDHPLPCDIVVIDEASMVDLSMMFHLLDALPDDAKLILVGDPRQLPAVNAGSVVWDIMASGTTNRYSPTFSHFLHTCTGVDRDILDSQGKEGISDCMVELRQNYRIRENAPLESLQQFVMEGNAEKALLLLEDTGKPVRRIYLPHARALETCVKEEIGPHLMTYMRHITAHDGVDRIFAAFDSFRVLCAIRTGLFGVESLNRVIEEFLKSKGNIPVNRSLYAGKAIMITENDYSRQLFNGDIGILLGEGKNRNHWSFYFRAPENANVFREVSPHSLPKHEKAFAMTIHKSQGSEYDEVFMFLPHHDSPVLTQELIYTGVTRAKKGLVIAAGKDIFTASLTRRTVRYSGLTEKLNPGMERSFAHGCGN